MPAFKNSSNSEKYLPLELTLSSWTQNWKKTGCCLFHVFFSGDSELFFINFLLLIRGVKRFNSCNRFPIKVSSAKSCSKSYSIYLVRFVERKRWKKAKILIEVEMTGSILSPKCPHALLNLQRKNKNYVFSESKIFLPYHRFLDPLPKWVG